MSEQTRNQSAAILHVPPNLGEWQRLATVHGLPCVSFRRGAREGADFWSVEESATYEASCERGRHIARAVLGVIADPQQTPLLSIIAVAMIRRRRAGGCEIGFWGEIEKGLKRARAQGARP